MRTTARGRSLDFIEDFIRDEVLPRYANPHTESSGIGLATSRLREDARQIIRDAVGGTDLADLERQLIRFASRPLRIGSFSAASNVTGILTDTDAVTRLLHAHGALSFWDYAAAGPYVPIRVAASAPGAGDHKDAVFLSPHKFPGGPQTPGVLVVRRELVRNSVPTVPGGGTVAFVNPVGHRYLDDPVSREEGGTPAIVDSIRAGLVLGLKQAIGTGLIGRTRGTTLAQRPAPLGGQPADRDPRQPPGTSAGGHLLPHQVGRGAVPAPQFRCGTAERPVRHPGPRRLLLRGALRPPAAGHHPVRSHALREEIGHGCDGVKPGWTRVNLNYFVSAATAGYITDAIDLIAAAGYRLLPDCHFDPRTGLWRHAQGARSPRCGCPRCPTARMVRWPTVTPAPRPARVLSLVTCGRHELCWRTTRPAWTTGPTGLSPGLEALRWFPLPQAASGTSQQAPGPGRSGRFTRCLGPAGHGNSGCPAGRGLVLHRPHRPAPGTRGHDRPGETLLRAALADRLSRKRWPSPSWPCILTVADPGRAVSGFCGPCGASAG